MKETKKQAGKLGVIETITAIRDEKEGFSFGEVWRFNEKAVSAVLPIIRKSDQKRAYKTLVESERVNVIDTGNIDDVRIENKEDVAVFIRMGEILKGDTQERSPTQSMIVMSGKTKTIEVRCIHETRGIAAGTKFKSGGIVPTEIESVMYRKGGGQSQIWAGVRLYSHSREKATANYMASMGEEADGATINLIGSIKKDDLSDSYAKYSTIIDDVIKKVPFLKNQAGLVIIDSLGFSGLEVYDLTDSWKMVRNAITKGSGSKLAEFDDGGVFEYKPERAVAIVLKALSQEFKVKSLKKDANTEIVRLESGQLIGEAAILKGEVIHLRIFRT